MIKGLTKGCTKLVQKLLPDAFLFSILLSAIVFILFVKNIKANKTGNAKGLEAID